MASLSDLARQHTTLGPGARSHLRRLIASWGLLSDLSFADLLLFAPTVDRFLILGQIRPTTAQTLYLDDQVGTFIDGVHRPLVARALESGQTAVDEFELEHAGQRVAVRAVPVRFEGEVIGVLTIETPRLGTRPEGELERTYLGVFSTLVQMISDGVFPFADEDTDNEQSPRVGDGVVVLNGAGTVEYSSPNATSALHRMGFLADTRGRTLEELGFRPDALLTAMHLRVPVVEEIERGSSVTILARLLPLIVDDQIDGALLLMRDVSELRRQERLLVSMDATIREIHHRVKNNLQTVSSLLRLQGRRVEVPEAKAAIEESVRRIRSIALVHEILAQEGGDDVAIGEVVGPIVEMVESALVSPECPIRFRVVGVGPSLPAATASSLAVILTELLQNAVEHGYPDGSEGGQIVVEIAASSKRLVVSIHDDGVGLPDGFDLHASQGLGLTIVRTLASGDLAGEITMRAGSSSGTTAKLAISLVSDDEAASS
ncbi:MAG: two-component sensor histidine kinase [Acidimicrobiales bacterium]|jgi:two-component system, sensor histidine kinase PdtaS